ncbi:hypothetical protein LMH87_006110 [Akanthomyces muscarius]|uniref:Fibronectin type-III domain-containing protein n=1 Tax=Akanthomyces muscarius TaxID=2231603 RepID=A0A9W8QQ56_AKAMU|nr:hypothetical protein LMH87_006110 [Akanthomyces muscarius]KAJ4164434.1 hypothetical protein LMH87_006110 [Akanthomyces muscarius]
MVWQFLAWTAGTFFFVFFCYLLRPLEYFPITFFTVIAAAFIIFDPREWMLQSYFEAHEFLLHMPVNDFLEQYFHTSVTIVSALWLVHRTFQTLLKPVPELVNILGVDIPEPPDVCLAGIRSDAATLNWGRPPSSKPVQKYSIQVNGVHVGDSPGNEVAITVTGLKPNHFYNIRVIAVAPNNFQSAGPVIRLRTFGKDGKPQLGNARLPTNFSPDEYRRGSTDDGDDSESPSGPIPSLESAPVLDGAVSVVRDTNGSLTGQRRNTINRRHSPSVASSDRPQLKHQGSDEPELSLDELNRRFESIRKETEETIAQYAKDEAESKLQEDELKREKERKRQILKEKEEQTAQLKTQVRTTMEQMRAAEKERAKKEQSLKDKDAKKTKVKDSITKLELEIERMKTERKKFQAQKSDLLQKRDKEVRSLDEANKELQNKCAELESELKEKGKQLQDLKATRELLPGADDQQWKDEDDRLAAEWDANRHEIHSRLVRELKLAHNLDQQIQALTDQVALALQHQQVFYHQAGSGALDYDGSGSVQQKRLSLNGASAREQGTPSPHALPTSESGYPPPAGFVHAPFPPRLFMDDPDPTDEPHTEAEFKIASGPLSPLAQNLLPSNIFDEMEELDEAGVRGSYFRESLGITEDDPQSPASSNPSHRAFSSPHGSNHNLPYSPYETADRSSLNLSQGPNSPAASSHRLSSLLSTFQRNRGTKRIDEGPPIGSLKSGQSQSFPRGAEEFEGNEPRRRINFPWVGRSSTGPEGTIGGHFSLGSRRLNPIKPPNGADRDPNSRPASIASADMPRPSTDSGSIWGQPGDGAVPKNRLWQPADGRWPSRSNSRRPSIHGTGSLLTTTLASADDEILDEYDLRNPRASAREVGVIGSGHPATAKYVNQRLNPNAPTFMGNFFKKDRSKSRDATPSLELPINTDDSPSESRISRDTQSIHTQTSISVSESHESLTLDVSLSNAPSDLNSLSGSLSKDPENKVKKLFRKGSSSKFSLSSRLGKDSGLFKKGPGSTANSEKNMSADQRSSIGDVDDIGEDIQFGRSYDSMSSSPALGSKASKDGTQSRIGSWRFSKKKKGKDVHPKESVEVDRNADDE